MKTAFVAFLLGLVSSLSASDNTIHIKTDQTGVHYELYGETKVIESIEEIVKTVARNAKRPKYYIDIDPDRKTTFETVMQLLVRLKATGVSSFKVFGNERVNLPDKPSIDYSILDISSKNLKEDWTLLYPPPAR